MSHVGTPAAKGFVLFGAEQSRWDVAMAKPRFELVESLAVIIERLYIFGKEVPLEINVIQALDVFVGQFDGWKEAFLDALMGVPDVTAPASERFVALVLWVP